MKKTTASLGLVTAICTLAGLGCKSGTTRPPSPIVSVSVRAMFIKFAHLASPPPIKVVKAKHPTVDVDVVKPHSKVDEARNFVAMEIRVPQWVAAKVAPAQTATSPPRKNHTISSTAPVSSGMGKVYSTIKDSRGKAAASSSEEVIGIE